eukprot:56750-Rhodomonas_salina.1
MALALEFERGRYSELVDGMPDYNDDPIFQYIAVATAIQHGALQLLPEATDALVNYVFCKINYNFIILSIAGFSAQLSSKCYAAFPNIFAHQDALAVPHPLVGLREMADIHRNYQRDGAAINASSAWKENFAALGRLLTPETTAISDWINQVEKLVQGLNLARILIEAVNGVLCCNVIDKLASFNDASNPTAAHWLVRADALLSSNNVEVYAWSELFNILHLYLTADASKEEHTVEGT